MEEKLLNQECGIIEGDNTEENSAPLVTEDDIGVEIVCEIGRIELSINELLNLRMGDIVEFKPWHNSVKLFSNGKYLATGELVEIHGMIGVKITHR